MGEKRCREKKICAGLFTPFTLAPSKLLYKEQRVLLSIFMFFSCWENCFHITGAAADKYRKLVIGTGIIAKVGNRWIWSAVRKSSPLATGQGSTRTNNPQTRRKKTPATNLNTSLRPFRLHTSSQGKSRASATHVQVKPTSKYTPGFIFISFHSKATNSPENRDPLSPLM